MLCQAQPSSGDTTSSGDDVAVTVTGTMLLQRGCDALTQQLPKLGGSFHLLPPSPRWQCLAVQALLSAGQGVTVSRCVSPQELLCLRGAAQCDVHAAGRGRELRQGRVPQVQLGTQVPGESAVSMGDTGAWLPAPPKDLSLLRPCAETSLS